MKVFPNKDDSLPLSVRAKLSFSIVIFLYPFSVSLAMWQTQTGPLSQMEMHEFTDDFMWRHTDFEWCLRRILGEKCVPLVSRGRFLLKYLGWGEQFSQKASPQDKYNVEVKFWKIKLRLRQCNGKLRSESLFSGSVTEYVCAVPLKGIQEDESCPSTPCLTVWSWSRSQREGKKPWGMARFPWVLADAPWQIEAARVCSTSSCVHLSFMYFCVCLGDLSE